MNRKDITCIERGLKRRCVFAPNLFTLYSKAILRRLKVLPGLIKGGYNVTYTDEEVSIENTERKWEGLQDKARRTDEISIPRRRYVWLPAGTTNPIKDLRIGDDKIKLLQKYLRSVLMTKIQNCTGITKELFIKLK